MPPLWFGTAGVVTVGTMVRVTHPFKCIVAALAVAVGFSIPAGPLGAETLDEMFAALAMADPAEAGRIEERIVDQWSRSGSASMDLLLQRGSTALEEGDPQAAIEHFTAAIDHDPGFAEAYHGRATAYYLLDYTGPAIDDLRETLVLEPRHFGAMRGLAVMFEELGLTEEALEVYRRIMDIHPNFEAVGPSVERLEQELRGRSL